MFRKAIPLLAIIAVSLGASSAEAAANSASVRVDCQSQSAFNPYVRVRGTLFINGTGGDNVRGDLTIAVSTVNQSRMPVVGQYIESGPNIRFMELRPANYGAVDQIYIDLEAGDFTESSYVSFTGGDFRRMACRFF
jgi:hypothetical protein